MTALLIMVCMLVALVCGIRLLISRHRIHELDRELTFDLPCDAGRALTIAADAARGLMWEVTFTDGGGLFTTHIRAHNSVHVALWQRHSDLGNTAVRVWTNYRCADDKVVFIEPSAYVDTKRKRDKMVRAMRRLAAPSVATARMLG